MKYRALALLIIGLAGVVTASASGRRDPLNEAEVSQLREVAQEPLKRIPLLVKFAQARLVAIDQLRGDNKLTSGRGQQIHDLLEDFTNIADELDSNLDMYDRERSDLRKPLKEVIEAYTEWQLKLRGLKEADVSKDAAAAGELKEYEFPLDSAIEAVNSGLDTSRDMLEKHNQRAKDAKKKK